MFLGGLFRQKKNLKFLKMHQGMSIAVILCLYYCLACVCSALPRIETSCFEMNVFYNVQTLYGDVLILIWLGCFVCCESEV